MSVEVSREVVGGRPYDGIGFGLLVVLPLVSSFVGVDPWFLIWATFDLSLQSAFFFPVMEHTWRSSNFLRQSSPSSTCTRISRVKLLVEAFPGQSQVG